MPGDDTNDRKTVLVVEDEAILRLMAVGMVESAGFEAVAAASGSEAVRVLETRANIAVVFSDIKLPGMDGVSLARAIRDRWPVLPIILTSGHYHEGQVKLPPHSLFFAKPYRVKEVVAALKQMVA